MTTQTPAAKGNPASSQAMQGISARGLKLLAHRRPGFCTPIEPRGAALDRYAKTKASI
jgi:hypothetical protein